MYQKCELKLNGVSYDVTDDLKNWDEIETAYKRSGFDGVVRSFISEFIFVGATRTMLRNAVIKNGLGNDVVVTIYIQNNSWLWNKIFECKLDMSSISVSDTEVSFSCVDSTIASKIKAKKSTKFEYPVSGLATEQMTFNRISMNNWEKYILTVNTDNETSVNSVSFPNETGWYNFPLYTTDSSVNISGALEFTDQEEDDDGSYIKEESVSYICKVLKDLTVRFRIHIELDIPDYMYWEIPRISLMRYYTTSTGEKTASTLKYAENSEQDGNYHLVDTHLVFDCDLSAELKKDDIIRLEMYSPMPCSKIYIDPSTGEETIERMDLDSVDYDVANYYYNGSGFTLKADWVYKGASVSFDCLKPVTLLQSLLDSICGEGVTAVISDSEDERLSKCRLAPAESIRAFPVAKVYTSFNDFASFMETVFGYVYSIDDTASTVTFTHRDELFKTDEESRKSISEYKDITMAVDSSLLYSAVEIGSEAEDYDEENGVYEYNFKQSFTTGRTFNENTLTMDPAYRLDSLGVEYLVEKRSEDTTDDDSDDDVWAIYTNGSDSALAPDTSYESTITGRPVGEMFNQYYHPRYCIEANKRYLAAIADRLTYASSDGNSEWTFAISLTGDIELTDRKYSAFTLDFDTDDMELPEELNGLVEVNGYKGWITEVKMKYTKQEKVGYKLMLCSDVFG